MIVASISFNNYLSSRHSWILHPSQRPGIFPWGLPSLIFQCWSIGDVRGVIYGIPEFTLQSLYPTNISIFQFTVWLYFIFSSSFILFQHFQDSNTVEISLQYESTADIRCPIFKSRILNSLFEDIIASLILLLGFMAIFFLTSDVMDC